MRWWIVSSFLPISLLDSPVMAEVFVLIPGRTSAQGAGISEGKFQENYVRETTSLMMAPEDMERLGLAKADWVQMSSESGSANVQVPEPVVQVELDPLEHRFYPGVDHYLSQKRQPQYTEKPWFRE